MPGDPTLERPGYVFDTPFAHETERLTLGARLWDPGTCDRLIEAGAEPGAHCWEVGAGSGTVAGWLADRVAPGGTVVATDLRTDRMAWLDARGARPVRHDVLTDPPPGDGFDLVHARLVVQHLPDRRRAVRRMAAALRPGGVLMLEDTDTASLFRHPGDPEFLARVKDAAYAVMRASGYHPRCGLLNAELVRRAGLTVTGAEGRAQLVRGGTDAARWYRLWLQHLAPRMRERGLVTTDELDAALPALDDPAHLWLSQVMVTVTARRPA